MLSFQSMSRPQAGGKISSASFEMVSSFKKDPFVGHLATPITTSNFTKTYLDLLPIYKTDLSSFLKGLQIGLSHGYFLFGPFVMLGPLRTSEVASFIGFISTLSLLFILTAALVIYGIVSYSSTNEKSIDKSSVKTSEGWQQFTSGFLVGGFGGSSLAYLIFNYFSTLS